MVKRERTPPEEGAARAPYAIPRYRAPDDAIWYHVLHGNVPGHQLDFMYCADVPQGSLTQTHFGHLARLMKYIEPRERAPYAFALGNLSRDDVQHEPGHGGIALIFGLRVEGVVDHAGRAMPPYAHGVLAVDRALDYVTLLDAASVFYRRFLQKGSEDASQSFYRAYVDAVRRRPEAVGELLRRYVGDFDALPRPRPSDLAWDWVADESALPARITIVHADDDPFGTVAHTAAKLGAMLYRSNVKWTTISSGREFDIPGGLSIRFVPASDAPVDPAGLVVRIGDVPDDEAEMAPMLFGVKPRGTDTPAARVGWRKQRTASAPHPGPAPLPPIEEASTPIARAGEESVEVVPEPKSRRRAWIRAGGAAACVLAVAIAAASGLVERAPSEDTALAPGEDTTPVDPASARAPSPSSEAMGEAPIAALAPIAQAPPPEARPAAPASTRDLAAPPVRAAAPYAPRGKALERTGPLPTVKPPSPESSAPVPRRIINGDTLF